MPLSQRHHSFSGPYFPQAEEPGVWQKGEQKVWESPDPCFALRSAESRRYAIAWSPPQSILRTFPRDAFG